MYITAILMLLLAFSMVVSQKKDFKGLCPFDKTTSLPLRGFLALLILSHHLGQRSDIYPISPFTAGLGLQIVAVFFFISGYGLCMSYLVKGKSYLTGFLQKRMGKLLPKFIVLSLLMVFLWYFFSSIDIATQIGKFSVGWTPLPFSWFIYTILYVYLAFYACGKISDSPRTIGMLFLLTSMLYILAAAMVLRFPKYWYMTIMSVNLGYFVALYEKKLDKLFERRFAFYSSTIALLFVVFCVMVKSRNEYMYLALEEMWVLALTMAVYVIVRTLGFFQWKWLCFIGVYSLEVYLIHGIILLIAQKMGLENWYLWLFTYAVSIPAAYLLNKCFDKLSLRPSPSAR